MSNATVHVRAEIGVSGHSPLRLGAHFLSSEQKVPYLPNYPQKVGGEAYPSAVMRYTSIIKYRFPINWTGSSKRV